jgi:hypothetical protein
MDADVCQFPTGSDTVCGRPVARTGAAGRPGRHCNRPEHTRAKEFAARRVLERAGALGGPGGELLDEQALAARPVSDGRVSLGVLLARFAEEAAEQRDADAERAAQMTALLDRAEQIAATATDPDAAGYEVDQARREAGALVSAPEGAQAAPERVAQEQTRLAEREAELRAQADDAAEEALTEADIARADTAAARDELTQTREQAAAEVEQARAAAEETRRTVDAGRDQAVTAAAERARQEVEQARADAAARVATAETAADQARRDAAAQVQAERQRAVEAGATRTRARGRRRAARRRRPGHHRTRPDRAGPSP